MIQMIQKNSRIIYLISFALFMSSCSSKHVVTDSASAEKVKNDQSVWRMENISFICKGTHCLTWQKWLNELMNKKNNIKIPKHFFINAPKDTVRFKNFGQFLAMRPQIEIYYSDYHCLEGQLSCTFDGEQGKIFFNYRALSLSKEEWIGVVWHELFHINYPQLTHISCTSCPDKKSRLYEECDKNSFSSYGFERLWHQTQHLKFSSDKKSKKKNKIILNELNKRICN